MSQMSQMLQIYVTIQKCYPPPMHRSWPIGMSWLLKLQALTEHCDKKCKQTNKQYVHKTNKQTIIMAGISLNDKKCNQNKDNLYVTLTQALDPQGSLCFKNSDPPKSGYSEFKQ